MFALVWIHLLAAVVWVGGMVFLSVVLVPVLKRDGDFARHVALFRTVAYRFRGRGLGAINSGGHWFGDGHGAIDSADGTMAVADHFVAKISMVSFLFTLTLLHDLVVDRRCVGSWERLKPTGSSRDRMLVRYSALVPRPSLLVALWCYCLPWYFGPYLAQTVHQYLPSSDPVTRRERCRRPVTARPTELMARRTWSRRSACDWLLSASFITTPHKVKTTAFRRKNATANEPVVKAQASESA